MNRFVVTSVVLFGIQIGVFLLLSMIGADESYWGWAVWPGVTLGTYLAQQNGAKEIAELPYIFGGMGLNMLINAGLLAAVFLTLSKRPEST